MKKIVLFILMLVFVGSGTAVVAGEADQRDYFGPPPICC